MIFDMPSASEIVRLSCDVNTWLGLLHLYLCGTQKSQSLPLCFFPDMGDHFYQKGWRIPK